MGDGAHRFSQVCEERYGAYMDVRDTVAPCSQPWCSLHTQPDRFIPSRVVLCLAPLRAVCCPPAALTKHVRVEHVALCVAVVRQLSKPQPQQKQEQWQSC
jgi:hypothetical protein